MVAAHAVQLGYHRLGLTGTRYLVDSEVYPEKLSALGLEYLRPNPVERAEINRIIFDELVVGSFTPAELDEMKMKTIAVWVTAWPFDLVSPPYDATIWICGYGPV